MPIVWAAMQLADWFLPLITITADDPHGRSAHELTNPSVAPASGAR